MDNLTYIILASFAFPSIKGIHWLPSFEIVPFHWMMLPEWYKHVRGEYNDHVFHFLFVKMYVRVLNEKGVEGRKYRKEVLNEKKDG